MHNLALLDYHILALHFSLVKFQSVLPHVIVTQSSLICAGISMNLLVAMTRIRCIARSCCRTAKLHLFDYSYEIFWRSNKKLWI